MSLANQPRFASGDGMGKVPQPDLMSEKMQYTIAAGTLRADDGERLKRLTLRSRCPYTRKR
ncbi:MAG: hypothetical protein KatS3mg107_0048 [Gemmataceae bacterium]|jgi:hypothetical protein|nr:MAG: hypothetical protein KatS3mg107_0048 [Gemmataceae bacterium]